MKWVDCRHGVTDSPTHDNGGFGGKYKFNLISSECVKYGSVIQSPSRPPRRRTCDRRPRSMTTLQPTWRSFLRAFFGTSVHGTFRRFCYKWFFGTTPMPLVTHLYTISFNVIQSMSYNILFFDWVGILVNDFEFPNCSTVNCRIVWW